MVPVTIITQHTLPDEVIFDKGNDPAIRKVYDKKV